MLIEYEKKKEKNNCFDFINYFVETLTFQTNIVLRHYTIFDFYEIYAVITKIQN